MERKQIIIDGLKTSYLQGGKFNNSSPIIFLHGWKSEALHLKNIWENFENWIALDIPGFGESELPNKVWSLEEYSDFLEKFLFKLNTEQPILVGHSFGGSIILKYLMKNSAKKAILIDSSGIRKRGVRIFIYKVLAKIFKLIFFLPYVAKWKEKIRKKFYSLINSEDYLNAEELKEIYKKIIQEDLSEDLGKIKTPVVLFWGKNDTDTPVSYGRMMEKMIWGSKLHIIPNAGHFSFIDNKEFFNKIFKKEIADD